MAAGPVNVYETVNLARRESLVAVSELSPDEYAARLASARPAAIAHWPPEEEVFTDLLTDRLETADAETFLSLFAKTTSANGWKVVRWTP